MSRPSIGSRTPIPDIVSLLSQSGCPDITSQLDLEQCSQWSIDGGGQGDIYRGILVSGEQVAIKTSRGDASLDLTQGNIVFKRLARELYTWFKLKHQNTAELLGMAVFRGHIAMISSWIEPGNFYRFIAMFPEADRMDLCFQVANGLLYLHASGVVFGDLKAQNVLIDHGGTAKLTDFGLSVLRDSSILFSSTGNPGSGTARWMAPELFEESSMRSSEGDMYALAMTFIGRIFTPLPEILTDRFPFPHLNNDTQVILAVVYRNAMPNRPERLEANSEQNEEFWSLLLQCWNRQPNMRPNAATIAQKLEQFKTICHDRACSAKCALCARFCCRTNRFHQLDSVAPHLCGQEHICIHPCEAMGICEIQTEPSATKKWFSGGYGDFPYTMYSQVARRLNCVKPIPSGELAHTGPHTHNTKGDLFHYCDARCPSCEHFCALPLGHPQQLHDTSHGSMTTTEWMVLEGGDADPVFEVQGRKFRSGDEGAPMLCNMVCATKGRHAHIDYCRDPENCVEPECEHINKRMHPEPDRPKDWISHRLWWARSGFRDPYTQDKQTEFSRCDVLCAGPEHKATATAAANPSYCILPIFHSPHSQQPAPATGYVSIDGHLFSCQNPSQLR